MSYSAPTALDEALAVLDAGNVSVIAGGTDWFPAQGDRPVKHAILDVSRISEFAGISRQPGGWRIGAAVTWSALIAADLPPCFDGLKAAAREVGSVQIQNTGTVVGNLTNASPAADGVPPLLTLNAQVEIVSRQGSRVVPLDQFVLGVRKTALGQGELVAALVIPDLDSSAQGAFLKLGSRKYLVISIAMVAVVVAVQDGRVSDARIAVGACSAVAHRVPALEHALVGKPADACQSVVQAGHFTHLSPIADVRGSAEYRTQAVQDLCQRALNMALAGQGVSHG